MTKPEFDGDVWTGLFVALTGTDVLAGTLVCVWVDVGVEVDPAGGVFVAVWVAVDSTTFVGVFVGVFVAASTGVFVGVLVAVFVGVSVGVFVGVFVGVSVGVFVAVSTGVFVGVSVGVFVAVLVGVSVGVFVGVLVGVFVGVSVGVLVAVLVGVFVAVFVAVLVGVLVDVPETTRVPEPVAVPDWQPAPLPASTLKVVEPAGVPGEVVRVSVDDASPPLLVTDEGLNTAVTPLGNAEVMLKGDVQDAFVPLKLTVME